MQIDKKYLEGIKTLWNNIFLVLPSTCCFQQGACDTFAQNLEIIVWVFSQELS